MNTSQYPFCQLSPDSAVWAYNPVCNTGVLPGLISWTVDSAVWASVSRQAK